MNDPQKYTKVYLIIDDGETTSIDTFHRAKDFTFDTVYEDPYVVGRPWLYSMSFKAERDQTEDCVSTKDSFRNKDGALYIRRGDLTRKLGL